LHHIIPLAPLHLPLAIQTIQTIREIYPDAQLFAVFDTQFHHTMPDKAKYYALPTHVSRQHHIYRYGFHGLAYSSMLNLYTQHLRIPKDQATFIGIHLGSGCSMCAIKNGQSIETSMGFSPLEGLISRTRTGTIDPTVLVYLYTQTGQPIETLLDMFNKDAGLKGLSNTDGNIQNVLTSQTPEAQQAIDMFVYRILLYIGAYDMILETQAPIVLSGGISEHARSMWERLASHTYLGVAISDMSPDRLDRPLTELSTHESKRKMYVACIDEEREIAEHINTAFANI
ncbi:MAG: acetate kinase, partial [Patescibacteria group bacterium]|nr:acetate kinase [Patescibacteria group bacterium]